MEKEMWDAYAKQAGGVTFDGKPLPTWDELGEERQACWKAAAATLLHVLKQLDNDIESAITADDEYCKTIENDNKRLRDALKELLNVIPNFPPDGNFLVGMKERYNQALIEARAALKESE